MGPLDRRLDRVLDEIATARSMAARAYEAAQGWPEMLEEVRSAPDYGTAFEGDPLVSVRIATYNRADMLTELAVASLLRQSYENWEAVIVGDACTDNTEARIAALDDPRVRFSNLPYQGPYPDDPRARWQVAGYNAMNAGLRAARGRWIAALDDDDEFDDDHIEVLLREAQRTRAELVYGRMRAVMRATGERVEDIGVWPPRAGQFNFLGSIVHAGLGRFEYDYNTQFAGEVGDWNLVRRLWESGVRFSFIDRPVGTYYINPRVWHTE